VLEITIRNYESVDAVETGILIADTYWKYNLSYVSEDEKEEYLGGFYFSRSAEKKHMEKVAGLISAPLVIIAETAGRIAGVLRGSPGRLHSLFVHEDFHRLGIGSMLVSHFEDECCKKKTAKITLAASLYAVPFYTSQGYKKSTGVRRSWSFSGRNFYIQPMKKLL